MRSCSIIRRAAPQSASIPVIDANGKLKIDLTWRLPVGLDFTHRNFFSAHRYNSDLSLMVEAPYTSNSAGDQLIVLSRRINHPDGSFAGVVAGAMHISYIQQLFNDIALDQGGTITLMGTDGAFLARSPYRASDVNRMLVNAALFKHFPTAKSGQFRDAGSDGTPRLYAYRQLGDLPLLINVTVPESTVLADWWHKALIVCGLVVCFAGLLDDHGLDAEQELLPGPRRAGRPRERAALSPARR